MIKRILSIVFLVFILTGIYLGFHFLNQNAIRTADPYRGIPGDAALIIESKNYSEFVESLVKDNAIWKELADIAPIDQFTKQLYSIDSVISLHETFSEITGKSLFLLSGHLLGKDRQEFIFYFSISKAFNKKQFIETLNGIFPGEERIKSRSYNSEDIYEFTLPGGKQQIYFCYAKGILFFSKSNILVENVIRQFSLKNASVTDQREFQKVAATVGKNVDANVFIHWRYFPQFFNSFVHPSYQKELASFSHLARWGELDLLVKEEDILMNGFFSTCDSCYNFIDIFRGFSPVEMKVTEVLPSNVGTFYWYGVDNMKLFRDRLKDHYLEKGRLNAYYAGIKDVQEIYGTDPEKIINQHFTEEIAWAYSNNLNATFQDNIFLIVKLKSSELFKNEFLEINAQAAGKKGIRRNELESTSRFDRETSFTIYRNAVEKFPSACFGELMGNIPSGYFTFVDNYLVFGNSSRALTHFQTSNLLHKTIENDVNYHKLFDQLSTRSNLFFFTSPVNSSQCYSHYLASDFVSGVLESMEQIKRLYALGFQLSSQKDMYYSNLYVKYLPDITEKPETVWESLLDTAFHFKPKFVTNHYTGENEIFIQDLQHTIYLINAAGRILWKVPLKEKIISDVYQVDYFRNGKLQLLFNTENDIHLVDRNGNYVERYPVRLRSPASNGMGLFDYDNNREYRIFLAGKNRKTYVYDKTGNIVEGWDFDKTGSEVKNPIQHFRVGARDYIVFADKEVIYILDRRGNTRIKPKKMFPVSKNNVFVLEPATNQNKARLAITDTLGVVHYIYFSGEVEDVLLKGMSPDHFFDYQDVDADGYNDFIFLDNNELDVFKQNKNKLFNKEFSQRIYDMPLYFTFSARNRKLGVVSRNENKIYLLNKDGSVYKGFPLQGNTLFSIGFLSNSRNRFNLIVGNKDNFLYNYSVQ